MDAIMRPPLIAWKVLRLDPAVASVRYRCLFPVFSLDSAGWRSVVFEEGETLVDERVTALVLVKSFTDSDLALARRMHARGVPIFLDLCDNVFVSDYAANALINPVGRFEDISKLAAAIVVPTEELARRLRERLPSGTRIEVIPDQLESLVQCRYLSRHGNTERLLNRQLVSSTSRAIARHPLRGLAQFARWISGRVRQSTKVATALPATGRKRLIWFGTHGAAYSAFGMGTLKEVIPALVKLDKRIPIELLVVSNNQQKFRALIRELPFPAFYRPWGMVTIFDDIASSDVCLLPNALDEFSICKSPNRAVLALSVGVPVVATGIPSLALLKDCIIQNDWLAGLHTYLSDARRRERDLSKAAEVIARHYSAESICTQWVQLLGQFADGHYYRFPASERAVRQ